MAYALAMALTLVYTADHFVFDVLLGWTYVIVVRPRLPLLHEPASVERNAPPS